MAILFLIIMLICGVSNGEVYKVGDASGWTSLGNLTYKSWAASKTFHVGDVIVFEYNRQFHDVLRVTHNNFRACNTTAPISTWSTGNDSFTITHPGHFYFVCGVPGHCQRGQKVDIRVPRPDGPAPSPLPLGPSSGGPTPSSPSPAPAPHPHKNGSSSLNFSWKLWSFLLIVIGFKAIAF